MIKEKKFDYIVREIQSCIKKEKNEDIKIDMLNTLKEAMHEVSPFRNEPVDCVLWKKSGMIKANDYNPNKVAPPEMELLKVSIIADGYTQPIVAFPEEKEYVVVDGFHRCRIGKEVLEVNRKVRNYLPITIIRESQEDKADRISSTIRHNRARGKHQIQSMSQIVLELKRRNWSDNKIAKNLGMDSDEILRLTQISGMRELFKDKEFSNAWEIEDGSIMEELDETGL